MSDPYSVRVQHSPRESYAAAVRFMTQQQSAIKTRRLLNPQLRIEEERAREVLKSLEDLPAGWDGYGSLAISMRVRLNAWRALNTFLAEGLVPEIAPNANGTVSLEWETDRVRAHLQVGRDDYSMYIKRRGSESRHFDGSVKSLNDGPARALAEALSSKSQPTEAVSRIAYDARRESVTR